MDCCCCSCSCPLVANLGDARSVVAPGGSPQRTSTSIARPLVDVSDVVVDDDAPRVDMFTAPLRTLTSRQFAPAMSPSTWADALDDWRGGSASEYAECTSFNTTGQLVWPAARRLVEYLERSGALEGVEEALELGSGNGWLGCVLARACAVPRGSLRTLTLTEMEAGGALRWLRTRVEANTVDDGNANAEPSELRERNDDGNADAGTAEFELRCKALDWNDVESALTTDDLRYDVVLGADLVYEDAGVHMLPRVIKKLLDANPKAVCYYSHTKHRYDGMDMDFFEAIERAGLTREEVREPEVPSPPPSPPPFESLFPEQRVAVYRIALA